MDHRICPYCDEVILKGRCCERMAKNLAEPIPFAYLLGRPVYDFAPSRRPRPRKATAAQQQRFDDVVRVIEDAHEEFV